MNEPTCPTKKSAIGGTLLYSFSLEKIVHLYFVVYGVILNFLNSRGCIEVTKLFIGLL